MLVDFLSSRTHSLFFSSLPVLSISCLITVLLFSSIRATSCEEVSFLATKNTSTINTWYITLYSHRWWEDQVLAGHWRLTPAWRPPAAIALASPPGVHPQPHSGWPNLGAHWFRPSTLGASAFPGARWHTSQHEATGKWTGELCVSVQFTLECHSCLWLFACISSLQSHKTSCSALKMFCLLALDASVWSTAEEEDLWDHLQRNH